MTLNPFVKAGIGLTFAHLEHLRLTGEMTRIETDGRFEYVLNEG